MCIFGGSKRHDIFGYSPCLDCVVTLFSVIFCRAWHNLLIFTSSCLPCHSVSEEGGTTPDHKLVAANKQSQLVGAGHQARAGHAGHAALAGHAGAGHAGHEGHESLSMETNKCKPNTSFIWCLPQDYNQEKHPFTCKVWPCSCSY